MPATTSTMSAAERKDKFFKYVSNRPMVPISSTEVCKMLGVTRSTVHGYWKDVPKRLGGTYCSTFGVGFTWTPPYETKNHEGYSDPTATRAIKNVIAESKKRDNVSTDGFIVKPGCVYKHFNQNESYNFIYIIKVTGNGQTLSVPVFKEGSLGFDQSGIYGYPIELYGSADVWCLDVSKISTRKLKYTKEFVAELGMNTYMDVLKIIGEMLGITVSAESKRVAKLEKELDGKDAIIEQLKRNAERSEKEIAKLMTTVSANSSDLEQIIKAKDAAIRTKDNGIKELQTSLEEAMQSLHLMKMDYKKLREQYDILDRSYKELKASKVGTPAVSDKKARIEMELMKAKLDIYERELFS